MGLAHARPIIRGARGSGKEIRGARRTQHRAFRPTAYLQRLLLRAQMCRARVGRCFRKDKAVRSSYSKTRIMPCYAMFKRPVRDVTSCVGAWSNYTIFSADPMQFSPLETLTKIRYAENLHLQVWALCTVKLHFESQQEEQIQKGFVHLWLPCLRGYLAGCSYCLMWKCLWQ